MSEYDMNHSPETLAPLPAVLRHGLAAVGTFGVLSFISSTALTAFLAYKLIMWQMPREESKDTVSERPESPPAFDHNGFLLQKEPPNQFLILVLNLFFADAQQSVAFLLSFHWLAKDAIQVGTSACWAQGWFISNGDLASSVFITGIAIHTYLAMWTFVYLLNALAVVITQDGAGYGGLFVRAGAWPQKTGARPKVRVSALGRSTSRAKHYPNPDPNWQSQAPGSPTSLATSFASSLYKELPPIPDSARQQTFLLYPLIYVVCTLPLAAGRLASMAGNEVSLSYFCFAGAAIACNGWLDVALYTYTRRAIVFADGPPTQDTGINTAQEKWNEKVVNGGVLGRLKGGKNQSQDSLKGFGMGKGAVMGMAIQCETTTTVSVEYDTSDESYGAGSNPTTTRRLA
ncbi:unnamed protein product [Parascedosporium putredinis]|uniref:Glucose receptor Git3 N-terminal domain-containing protein n=1 Tax=Parascedosporium putredinis TaxID=1442378 RepID=A0A9P1M7U6_9PEZI|nr:unnamed protein product [Parascedosporium putredinis]CAI7991226.1 unnamed protein product [Parascedosporium putredinis]